MFEQFENMLLNPLVQKLNEHGVQIDVETIKKGIANSPQIVGQIEEILMSSNSQDKVEKIKALFLQVTQGGDSSTPPSNDTK